MTSIITSPSESFTAVSIESESLLSIPDFTAIRSTTTSIVCFLFLSSSISSVISIFSPSTLTLTYPSFLIASSNFSWRPFFPLTTGDII